MRPVASFGHSSPLNNPKWQCHDPLATQDGRKPPPVDAKSGFVCVTFEAAITGPFALGYGAHFGLGLMRPVG